MWVSYSRAVVRGEPLARRERSHDKNRELSKQRAKAVRAMFLSQFPGVAPERVASEGLGYFAPVASNATPEGREMNRRVEVILVPAN